MIIASEPTRTDYQFNSMSHSGVGAAREFGLGTEPLFTFAPLKFLLGKFLTCLPPSVPCYIYTVLLKPRLLRRFAHQLITRFVPRTMEFRGSRVALNQRDAIVSGSLALGSYETFVGDILEELIRPGTTFFDVGANIGIYTALAARLVGPAGRVVAVEPEPGNVEIIQETLRLNAFKNVTVAACAAGDHAGPAALYISKENAADHRLHDPAGQREEVAIETITLDALAADCGVNCVDVIKVDTQGWEGAVFAGMTQLIASNPDLVIVTEFWPWGLAQAGTDPLALLNRFVDSGLDIYEIDSDHRRIEPRHDLNQLTALKLERQHLNLLLCRNSRSIEDLRAALQRCCS